MTATNRRRAEDVASCRIRQQARDFAQSSGRSPSVARSVGGVKTRSALFTWPRTGSVFLRILSSAPLRQTPLRNPPAGALETAASPCKPLPVLKRAHARSITSSLPCCILSPRVRSEDSSCRDAQGELFFPGEERRSLSPLFGKDERTQQD